MARARVLIAGAAGRDFHNFNLVYRDSPVHEVVAFTATQIPNIEGRQYPPVLAGKLYPNGIPIKDESELEDIVATVTNAERIDTTDLPAVEFSRRAYKLARAARKGA